ncbi:hypothetical protein [Gemmatimonas sp.]|uniref:hypothetical protein n=1 Tax=Gemmatimonas sp. TaxID=1962908 RepID=UPI0039838630
MNQLDASGFDENRVSANHLSENRADEHRRSANRVTIIAFDGIVADTIPLRATALAESIRWGCASLDIEVHAHDILPVLHAWLPGLTFNEAMSVAIEQLPALRHERIRNDVTLHDLIAMRAQRAWSAVAAHGVALRDGVLSRLETAVARGLRMVLRSDSQRREVEPVLRLAGLEDCMLFLRCADDLPRLAAVPTLQASYDAIDARLDRLRIPRTQRDAVEVSHEAATLALDCAETSRTAL